MSGGKEGVSCADFYVLYNLDVMGFNCISLSDKCSFIGAD